MDPRTARLPGVLPVEGDDWLRVDDAFAGQMAERGRLIADCPAVVHAMLDSARPAARSFMKLSLRGSPGLRATRSGRMRFAARTG
jgi:hypothetical protein